MCRPCGAGEHNAAYPGLTPWATFLTRLRRWGWEIAGPIVALRFPLLAEASAHSARLAADERRSGTLSMNPTLRKDQNREGWHLATNYTLNSYFQRRFKMPRTLSNQGAYDQSAVNDLFALFPLLGPITNL